MMTDDPRPIRRSRRTASRIVEGEAVVLTPVDGCILTLNATATRIWERLEAPATLGELVELLRTEFDVEAAQARDDAARFVDALLKRGMLEMDGDD
jgi:hypothetical protein